MNKKKIWAVFHDFCQEHCFVEGCWGSVPKRLVWAIKNKIWKYVTNFHHKGGSLRSKKYTKWKKWSKEISTTSEIFGSKETGKWVVEVSPWIWPRSLRASYGFTICNVLLGTFASPSLFAWNHSETSISTHYHLTNSYFRRKRRSRQRWRMACDEWWAPCSVNTAVMHCSVNTAVMYCSVNTAVMHCSVNTAVMYCSVNTAVMYCSVNTAVMYCSVNTAVMYCSVPA